MPGPIAALDATSARFSGQAALCMRDGNQGTIRVTYEELTARARALASYLMEVGIEPDDRVAILSDPRPEWLVALFGAIRAGAIVVPLDPKLSQQEILTLLLDCAPRALFVASEQSALVPELESQVPSLRLIGALDARAEGIPPIDTLIPHAMPPSRERGPGEVALIVYTSGTTGDPKGVMTTFENLMFQAARQRDIMSCQPGDCFLSILPLNHLLGLVCSLLVLSAGGTVCYPKSLYPQDIIDAMREFRVVSVFGVPSFFWALRNGLQRRLSRGSRATRIYYALGSLAARMIPSTGLARLMFLPLHHALGGRVRAFFSGGAPLDPAVGQFFNRIGLPVLQGYGLTETSPIIATNSMRHHRIGSVGKPIAGIEVRVDTQEPSADEGEILTRGPHLMKGYYRRLDLTREAIDAEGWLHTGDIGRLDRDGFLYVTGRIKDMIVLPGGKKVQPDEVEAVLAQAPSVGEVCVLGRKGTGPEGPTEEVCAVVVPSDALAPQLAADPELVDRTIRRDVEQRSVNLAPYKRPFRIFISAAPLPKTATRKVKRLMVREWLASQEHSVDG